MKKLDIIDGTYGEMNCFDLASSYNFILHTQTPPSTIEPVGDFSRWGLTKGNGVVIII